MAGLRVDTSGFVRGMNQELQRRTYIAETYGKAAGNKMVAYAKRNHPWTNRTYMAQNTITSSAQWYGHVLRIGLHSGVNYGVYLEFKRFKHKGRLSIFFPTVRAMTPEILAGWAERMKG